MDQEPLAQAHLVASKHLQMHGKVGEAQMETPERQNCYCPPPSPAVDASFGFSRVYV